VKKQQHKTLPEFKLFCGNFMAIYITYIKLYKQRNQAAMTTDQFSH